MSSRLHSEPPERHFYFLDSLAISSHALLNTLQAQGIQVVRSRPHLRDPPNGAWVASSIIEFHQLILGVWLCLIGIVISILVSQVCIDQCCRNINRIKLILNMLLVYRCEYLRHIPSGHFPRVLLNHGLVLIVLHIHLIDLIDGEVHLAFLGSQWWRVSH